LWKHLLSRFPRLKTEVAALKSEIAFLKGEQGEAVELTEDEEAALYSSAKTWVNMSDESIPFDIGAFTVSGCRIVRLERFHVLTQWVPSFCVVATPVNKDTLCIPSAAQACTRRRRQSRPRSGVICRSVIVP
jgi:hypothetical protein